MDSSSKKNKSILMPPRPPLLGRLGPEDGARQRRLVPREDGHGGGSGDGRRSGGTAEGDDLVPGAVEIVAEDHQEVSRLGGLQRALDGLLLAVDPGGDAVGRETGGEQALADQLARLAGLAAAAVVVFPQEDEIEGRGGGAGGGEGVLVAAGPRGRPGAGAGGGAGGAPGGVRPRPPPPGGVGGVGA